MVTVGQQAYHGQFKMDWTTLLVVIVLVGKVIISDGLFYIYTM